MITNVKSTTNNIRLNFRKCGLNIYNFFDTPCIYTKYINTDSFGIDIPYKKPTPYTYNIPSIIQYSFNRYYKNQFSWNLLLRFCLNVIVDYEFCLLNFHGSETLLICFCYFTLQSRYKNLLKRMFWVSTRPMIAH